MESGFTSSLGSRLLALGWWIRTLVRLPDWRAASLSVLVALLVARAIPALIGAGGDDTETPSRVDIGTSRLASLSTLFAVVAFDRGLLEAREPSTEKPAHEEAALPDPRQPVRLDRLSSIGGLTSSLTHDVINPTHTLQMSTKLFQRACVDLEPLLDDRHSRDSSLRAAGVPCAGLRSDRPLLFADFRGGSALNLLQNAHEAMTAKRGTVRIATRVEDDQHRVVLAVEDEGCGISEGEQERILDPRFTTKQDSDGTVLGLAAAAPVVLEHGGTLAYGSDPGRGTTMSVSRPASVEEKVAGGEERDG